MSKLVKSKGNMYPWVTHMHAHLIGCCSHECKYCYVQTANTDIPDKYKGIVRLDATSLDVNYGNDKVIFIDHMNDLFADDVSLAHTKLVLKHCLKYPDNVYVFQTKNPGAVVRHAATLNTMATVCAGVYVGVTIETNRSTAAISKAPTTIQRAIDLACLQKKLNCYSFVTIEPILDFDVLEFAELIKAIDPVFINIGADSKSNGLTEPDASKVQDFIDIISKTKIPIRAKRNLHRLVGGEIFNDISIKTTTLAGTTTPEKGT